jgi:foldase protein PrsA
MAFGLKKATSNFLNLFKRKDRTSSKKSKKINYKSPKFIISSLVGLLLIFVFVMGIGIYVFNWEDGFTAGVTSVVPYPAGLVNGRIILYHTYLEQLDIVKEYQQEFKKVDFKTSDGKKVLDQTRKDTMTNLVEDTLVDAEAASLKVVVSDKELNDQFTSLVKSNGGDTSFASVLKQYYGLTPTEFRDEIYRPRLLRQDVANAFANDASANADAEKLAEDVLAKVKAGGDFATLAKQYSQDTTASNGGDMGYFGKGKNVPEFDNVAFSLKVGEVSGLVKTVYGYSIIKVTDIKDDQIRASQILIKTKDFNTWLADAQKAAKIAIYIKDAK